MSAHDRAIQGARASGLFPALAYDDEQEYFLLEDLSLGLGWVAMPLAGGDEGQADRLSALINQDWPPNTLLQVLLWASPDIEPQLNRMNALRMELTHPVLRDSTRERTRFLRASTTKPIIPDADTRVRDIQLLILVKIPLAGIWPNAEEQQSATELRASVEQALRTIGLHPQRMNSDQYVRIMNTMLNWSEHASWRSEPYTKADPNQLLSQQLLDPDATINIDRRGLNVGGSRVTTLSVKRYPDRLHFGMGARYLSDPFSGTRGIPHNTLIVFNALFPDAEKERSGKQAQSHYATRLATWPLAVYSSRIGERARGFHTLFERLDAGDRLCRAYLGAVLFSPPEETSAAISNIRTYWREQGFQLFPDVHFALPLFLNALPFGVDRKAIENLQRYRTLSASHVVNMVPIHGDWKGTGTPNFQLISRGGQLMDLSLFDSASNYNACIAAQSGSGKSFLTNELISTTLAVGGRCWIIDVGRSYEKLCEALNGQFIAFERDSQTSFNPFELISHWEEEADMIAALLGAMISPSGALDDYRASGLKRVLKSVWDQLGRSMSIDAVAEALAKEPESRLRDLATQLYPFTRAGEYGRYFAGSNSIAFTSPFVVLELEELKGRKHLQQVVLLQLIYQIQQTMYLGNRDQMKLVIIDEAWDLLTQGDVAKFIETGYRRFRKYRGAAVTVTQSLNDLYDSPTGRAIAENSAHTFLLAQPTQAIDQLRERKRLPLTDGGTEMLKTVHTVPGSYSEIMCIGDYGAGIGRLVVDPYRQLLYSTHPRDVAALNALRDQGMSVDAAIRTLIDQRQPSRADANR